MTRVMQQFGREMRKMQGMSGRMNKMPAPDIGKHPVSHKFAPAKASPEKCEICGMRMTSHKTE